MTKYALYALVGCGIGILVSIPAIMIAIASSGAGHGDYGFARALFPLPMLLTRITDDTISTPSIALALVQFPIYGAVVGYGLAAARYRAIVVIAVLHVIFAAMCFAGLLPNFS